MKTIRGVLEAYRAGESDYWSDLDIRSDLARTYSLWRYDLAQAWNRYKHGADIQGLSGRTAYKIGRLATEPAGTAEETAASYREWSKLLDNLPASEKKALQSLLADLEVVHTEIERENKKLKRGR